MELLQTIGVNGTIFYQFIIFVVAFTAINMLAIKPYFRAQQERVNRTEGSQEAADDLIKKTEQLEAEYAERATKLNETYSEFYSKASAEAQKKADSMLSEARDQSLKTLETQRADIEKGLSAAKNEVSAQIPVISEEIVKRLVHS